MIKKKLDDWKIHLVLVCDSKDEADAQIKLLSEKGLLTPEGYECSMQVVIGRKNLAATFNDIQKKNNARFKFYLTAPLLHVDNRLLVKMLEGFFMEPKTAMVGLMGSELPITGDYKRAGNFYGFYNFGDDAGQVHNYMGKDFLLYKSVHMIESSFFATNEDIAWDEKIGDEFIVAAQCCNLRNRGYDIGVYYQEKPLIIFAKNTFSYTSKTDTENYNKQLEKFFSLYKKKIQPLVSVLIPTYNQPKFCCLALESALNQTYQNIEILIGDDSTNEDTKKAIRPYLKKNPNVKYFYHNGKIGRGGGANMNFLLSSCTGEFVNYLLHDDIFYPEKISKMMNYYVNDLENKICLISSARDRIDANGNFLNRQNQWQPHSDTVISGEEIGRRMLFVLANSVGELTTALFRKKSTIEKDFATGFSAFQRAKNNFSIGSFCGVSSKTYGDLDTWLHILKSGGDLIYMAESLSAFRKHEAQNTYNPQTRINLPLDALMFVVVAWLNDVFFRNADEFYYCLDKWPLMAERWFKPIQEDDSEQIKYCKNWIIKLREVFLHKNHEKMFDCAISFALDYLLNKYTILSRVKRNPYTRLWEKESNVAATAKHLTLGNHDWIVHGTPTITGKDVKFNSALEISEKFTCLEYNEGITLGGQDFTLEYWVYYDESASEFSTPLALMSHAYNYRYSPRLLLRRGGGDFIHVFGEFDETLWEANDFTGKSPIVGVWTHVELDYRHDGGIWQLFINGVEENSKIGCVMSRLFFRYLFVGHFTNLAYGRDFIGKISELRISDGIARHTENFTPPDKPHENDEYTEMLLHFDEDIN